MLTVLSNRLPHLGATGEVVLWTERDEVDLSTLVGRWTATVLCAIR